MVRAAGHHGAAAIARQGAELISIEGVSALIGRLQEAALGAAGWPRALEDLCSCMGVETAGLSFATSRQRRMTADFHAGLPDEAISAYNSHFWSSDIVPEMMRRVPVGAPRRIAEIVPQSSLRRSELYNEWALPSGMNDSMFVNLGQDGEERLTLCLTAEKPDRFEQPEMFRALRILVPHLQLALRTQIELAALQAANAQVLAALESVQDGLAIVTSRGILQYRNAAAAAILSCQDGLILQEGRLCASHRTETLALRRLVERAGGCGGDIHRTGGSLRITRLAGGRPVVVHVLPLLEERFARADASVLVLMIDPDFPAKRGPNAMREIFGLSAAEAAVASRIAGGGDLKSVADELSVSLATVRTHLQNVFEKTDTHRQADLVRLLLRTGVV